MIVSLEFKRKKEEYILQYISKENKPILYYFDTNTPFQLLQSYALKIFGNLTACSFSNAMNTYQSYNICLNEKYTNRDSNKQNSYKKMCREEEAFVDDNKNSCKDPENMINYTSTWLASSLISSMLIYRILLIKFKSLYELDIL